MNVSMSIKLVFKVWSLGWGGEDNVMLWVIFKEEGDEFFLEGVGCFLVRNLLVL